MIDRDDRDAPGRRPRRAAWLWLAALLALPAAAQELPAPGAPVDAARQALEEWVQVRRILSQERRDWQLGRELLEERIALVQREIDGLRTQMAGAQASIAEVDRKRGELLTENERLKASAASLAGTVAALEGRVLGLLGRVPEPIRERVRPLSQRIPAAGAETKLSLGERFQNVVGVLNELDKFHREISVTSEVRTLPDGTSAEVTAVYVGLSRGWYASADGRVAGTGSAGAQGWEWTPTPEAAAEIAQAIAILKNEQPAAFVRLPAPIDQGSQP